MNTNVDTYFSDGCGRCSFYGTPQCKVRNWPKELAQLRRIVLETGLMEESKWGVPCYTFQGKNIAIVSAFKEYCALSFFKGSLLQDTHGLLDKPGEHTQSARLIKFTHLKEVLDIEATLKAWIYEAIEVEKAGLEVIFEENPEPIPEELQLKMNENSDLKAAFEALTPGRKRGYILHFSAPKQSKTRVSRIEKCIPQILDGRGLNDRYQ
ncbi:MAG: YdeI/OmpD-associated family protein [Marinoscillum sp.]|uniref:YdeI/OmpD-associated family protein n=1 Tax=Marinoscillum sp. TaxID=2024838 RepID=UPI0032FAA61E